MRACYFAKNGHFAIDWREGSSVADGKCLSLQAIASCGNSTTPETLVPGRARGKRTRNGNQFSLKRKNSIFPSMEKCYFAFCPGLFLS